MLDEKEDIECSISSSKLNDLLSLPEQQQQQQQLLEPTTTRTRSRISGSSFNTIHGTVDSNNNNNTESCDACTATMNMTAADETMLSTMLSTITASASAPASPPSSADVNVPSSPSSSVNDVASTSTSRTPTSTSSTSSSYISLSNVIMNDPSRVDSATTTATATATAAWPSRDNTSSPSSVFDLTAKEAVAILNNGNSPSSSSTLPSSHEDGESTDMNTTATEVGVGCISTTHQQKKKEKEEEKKKDYCIILKPAYNRSCSSTTGTINSDLDIESLSSSESTTTTVEESLSHEEEEKEEEQSVNEEEGLYNYDNTSFHHLDASAVSATAAVPSAREIEILSEEDKCTMMQLQQQEELHNRADGSFAHWDTPWFRISFF